MSRRGVVLFSLMAVIWGIPYLLIKVAVEELSPSVVVAARTTTAALLLVPIAARRHAIAPALRRWRPLGVFVLIELVVPWFLLAHAEQTLPSSITGMLIACVPLVGMFVAYLLGYRRALRPTRLLGLAVGLAGVAMLVGFELDAGDRWSVAELLVVVAGYATAPFVVARKLQGVPAVGLIAVALSGAAAVSLVAAAFDPPSGVPSAGAIGAIVVLATVCTAVAFLLFFALIAEIGPDRAALFTFLNPAVAVTAGVLLRGERFAATTAFGFALVLAGCWFATRPDRRRVAAAALAAVADQPA